MPSDSAQVVWLVRCHWSVSRSLYHSALLQTHSAPPLPDIWKSHYDSHTQSGFISLHFLSIFNPPLCCLHNCVVFPGICTLSEAEVQKGWTAQLSYPITCPCQAGYSDLPFDPLPIPHIQTGQDMACHRSNCSSSSDLLNHLANPSHYQPDKCSKCSSARSYAKNSSGSFSVFLPFAFAPCHIYQFVPHLLHVCLTVAHTSHR